MYYCNEINGLAVLSLYEGELLGKVDKLYFDKKLKKLVELELITENDTRYLLPTKNIYHIGKNAITVKNNQAVNLKVEATQFVPAPLNSKAYSIKGEYLGIVKELTLNEKFNSEKFSLDNNTALDISSLASCGKCTIIFYDKTEHIDLSKFTPKPQPKLYKDKKPQKTNIMPLKEVSVVKDEKIATPVEVPKPIPQNAEFLLGRICTKDIFNFNNELLIKSHAVVNKKNLKEINKFGKLRELMLYTK